MIKFFKEHMDILIAIAVGMSIIGLATLYGREGGPVDNMYQQSFESVSSDVLNGGGDNGGDGN